MSGRGEELAERARRLVGAPFKPQGRDPGVGLDCVGVIASVYRLPADAARGNYRLRGRHLAEIGSALSRHLRRVSGARREAGDVLVCAVARDQAHLAVWCGASFVHADARLRRVVETPGDPRWPIEAVFRALRPLDLKS